jgi:hypothetical protein
MEKSTEQDRNLFSTYMYGIKGFLVLDNEMRTYQKLVLYKESQLLLLV